MAKTADAIRAHGQEKYVEPARNQRVRRFSIRTGEVVQNLKLYGRVPAVCSALKSREFLEQNGLRLLDRTGPPSGQSTTVTYTYEFLDAQDPKQASVDAWAELRGALKRVFVELGGGEKYLRGEREHFYANERNQ